MAIKKIISQADQVVNAIKSIDFEAVVAHQPKAIEQLEAVLAVLNTQSGEQASERQAAEQKAVVDDAQLESREEQLMRHSQILSSLKQEGFDGRLGKVYNSSSESRVMEFRQVPHRKELPDFDMVVAADYAPSAGLHGVFISPKRVYSAVLETPLEQNKWRVLKSRSYHSMAEMIETVTLLSAGFDLP